jgi:transposase
MGQYISFDSHKHYTLVEQEDHETRERIVTRLEHRRGVFVEFLRHCPPGSKVAVEASGNWYWIVDEIEAAGCIALLIHPHKAKLMMGMINKTDRLDVHGFNVLQRNGTLPVVWIPPRALRDLRELTRCRLSLVSKRTCWKNRVQAMLEKHALGVRGVSDPFGAAGRAAIAEAVELLPEQTRWVVCTHLSDIDLFAAHIGEQEKRLKGLIAQNERMRLLQTMPGVGLVLSASMDLEIGDITRFRDSANLAAYAGTLPRLHNSGGKVRHGRTRPDVNRFLKWAFSEAGNSVAVNHKRRPELYVSRLYKRIRLKSGHGRAVGAVARHLAQATWHIIVKNEPYNNNLYKE